jgi:hypothetical protein
LVDSAAAAGLQAFRFDRQMKLGRAMWKANMSAIDPGLCTRRMQKRCLFGGIHYDRTNVSAGRSLRHYGCGVAAAHLAKPSVS